MSFNYYDELKKGYTQQWISYMNKHYMETTAPIVKVFKLDKKRVQLDNFYGEVDSARLYLPPFDIRASHVTNPYEQLIGSGSMPYLEQEETMTFIMNFENMVNTIRDLRKRTVSSLYITYSGSGSPTAYKAGDYFVLKVDDSPVASFYIYDNATRTTQKMAAAINNLTNFSCTFVGNNDESRKIINFNETRFNTGALHIYTPDYTYRTISDVIEKGDVILTNKWRLYEVAANIPTQDFGWEYATFMLSCNLRTLDEAILPNNYMEQIKKHHYGFSHKINTKVNYEQASGVITPDEQE